MISRQELFDHKEKIWVLCVHQEAGQLPLPPNLDLIDWYNNQLLTKSLAAGRIGTNFGSIALLGTTGLLPVDRLLVFGLGERESLTAAQGRKFSQELHRILSDLKESAPWIIFPNETPAKFTDEIEKSRTSTESLAHAKISK